LHNKGNQMQYKQQGTVLAIGLVFLLILTLVGVAGSSQSLLGERLAGNDKQVAQAFMAAETGLVNAVTWLDNPLNAAGWGQSSYSLSAINTGASKVVSASVSSSDAGTSAKNPASWQISSLQFTGDNATIVSCGDIKDSGVKRCLTSTYVKGSGGGNLAAMNIIGKIKTFDTANSNQFKLIGADGGPALATDSLANVQLIVDDINSKGRMANYAGGVKEVKFDDPFGDPEKMAQFIAGIKAEWTAMATSNPKKGYAPGNMGTVLTPKITYHEGSLTMSGGGAIGAGILVVAGNLTISGNNVDYDGLIIVTGQSFVMKGGGNRDARGAVVFANPIKSAGGDWSFGQAEATFEFDINGGGNATFTYDAEVLKKARDLLSDNNVAKELWQVNGTASGGTASKGKVLNWSPHSNTY
jgi:Tfp pilus assembly protein PilX